MTTVPFLSPLRVVGGAASNYDSLFHYAKSHTCRITITYPRFIDFKPKGHLLPCKTSTQFHSNPSWSEGDDEDLVQDLRVPSHWSTSSKASEESEWLKVILHKWLDDEYCPEATNIEISKVAATSYYSSLMEKRTDLGDILLKMAKDLESISYQESFHGAFSSANAAISLIIQRIELNQ